MKNLILPLLFLVPYCTKGQSSSYSPSEGFEDHKVGRGLNHTDGTISLGTYNSANVAYIQTHTNHPLYFGNNSNANPKIVLSTSGLVGVNLANGVMPAEKLEILNGRISLSGWENANKPTGIEFTDNAGINPVAFLGMMDNTTFGFKSYTTNQYEIVFKTVAGQSRLGLGTTNPIHTLDVHGTISIISTGYPYNSLLKIKSDNTLSTSPVQPIITVSPFEFTYSDQGPLNESNVGYMPDFSYATWTPLGAYHFVEKALQLPQGSNIKHYFANIFDNNPNGMLQVCLLIMNNTTAAVSSYCLTSSDAPNVPSRNKTVEQVVDNNQYNYIIRVESLNNSGFQGGWGADMAFGAITLHVWY